MLNWIGNVFIYFVYNVMILLHFCIEFKKRAVNQGNWILKHRICSTSIRKEEKEGKKPMKQMNKKFFI